MLSLGYLQNWFLFFHKTITRLYLLLSQKLLTTLVLVTIVFCFYFPLLLHTSIFIFLKLQCNILLLYVYASYSEKCTLSFVNIVFLTRVNCILNKTSFIIKVYKFYNKFYNWMRLTSFFSKLSTLIFFPKLFFPLNNFAFSILLFILHYLIIIIITYHLSCYGQ